MDYMKEYVAGRMGGGGINGAAELGRQHGGYGAMGDNPAATLMVKLILLGLAAMFIAPVAAFIALIVMWKISWRSGLVYMAVLGAAFWGFTLGHDLGIYGLREIILKACAGWEFGWLTDALRTSTWADNMLFGGSLVGLAVLLALPSADGVRGLVGAVLSLPVGVCAGVAATPFAMMWSWALMPALVPVIAGAFFYTVGSSAERGYARGIIAMLLWGMAIGAAFGAYAHWSTPPEANIEFYKQFKQTTLVAWDATTNLVAGAVIGFGTALVGGLILLALFGRRSKPPARFDVVYDEHTTYEV